MLAATLTPANVQDTVKALPGVLTAATDLTAKAAAVSPRAVPVLQKLLRLLPVGPTAAPLLERINADVAAILRDAPSYAPVIRQVIDVLNAAPALAPQIAAVTGPMADFARRAAADPALGPFAARLVTIIDLARGPGGGPAAATPTTAAATGVGLSKLVPWMDRTITVLRHPWLLAAVPAVILVAVGGVGYAVGRR